ncbi:hypothetical protein BASA81_004512 [Batrachochytrium salamandrivorans]|nr:hypothetical protein BASA81_004512 [Batrachochytrium salamandrivorans]
MSGLPSSSRVPAESSSSDRHYPPPNSSSRRRSRSRSRQSRSSHRSRDRTNPPYRPPPPPHRLTEEEARMRDARCVLVTQLQIKATEEDVEFFFAAVCEQVVEVALVKEKSTGRSKGFGYVELASLDDVKSALLLSGLPFLWRDGTKGLPITVRPSEANKQYMEHGAVTITSNKQHQQLLKSSSSSSQPQPTTDQSKIELIEMVGPGSAKASVDGGPVQILPTHRGRPMNTKILFVGNLDKSLGERELKEVFQSFGPVENVQLKTDVATGESKGFAFCRYEQVACAANANDKLNGFELMGLKLTCNPVHDKMLASASRPGLHRSGGTDDAFTPLDGGEAKGVALHAARRMDLMAKLGGGAAQEWAQQPTIAVAAAAAATAAAATATLDTTPRIALSNMFDSTTETQPQWEMEIERDTKQECERFGKVISCVVYKPRNQVHVTFTSSSDAKKCAEALQGRWFDQHQIRVEFLPPS